MAFNITDITSRLAFGGARPTLFTASINAPSGGIPNFEFLCRSATLPESTVGFFEVPYFGRKIKLAGNREYGEWTVTVYNDEDFKIRHAFENWHSTINSIISNRSASNRPISYKTSGDVTQYGKSGNPLRTYRFTGLFPSVISPIQLDWNNTNQIEEFSVTFQYDYFTVEGATGNIIDGPSGGLGRPFAGL